MEVEGKFVNSGTTSMGAPSTAGVFNLLNGVAQGDDYTNRTGRQIYMDSLSFLFSAEPNTASTSPNGDILRIILFIDNQANGSTPATTDLLEAAGYLDQYNENNSERFSILLDHMIPLEANSYAAGALTTGDPKFHIFSREVDLNTFTIFNNTGATAAAITTGSLWFFCISAYGSWNASFNSRVVFFDS